VHKTQRSLLGARVLRIGDFDVEDAYAAAKTMIGHENEGGARYWAQYLLSMPEVLEALHITSRVEDVPMTLATMHGQVQVTLHPFAPVEIMSGDTSTLFYSRRDWIDARDLTTGPDPLWLREIDVPFHFEYVGDLLYVQINKVGDSANEMLTHFAQRLHNEISTMQPDKVAIDLRQNRGGNGTLIVPIIRCIIQSESIDRPGHLFGIVGPATFSAAQMLTDALEKYTNILFVGEATGSKGNTYGDSRKITLPNSGITVRASIYYWQDWHPMDKRDATVPQISAPLTYEAYSHKVDPALEAIINYGKPPSSPTLSRLCFQPFLEHRARETNVTTDLQARELAGADGLVDPARLHREQGSRVGGFQQRFGEREAGLGHIRQGVRRGVPTTKEPIAHVMAPVRSCAPRLDANPAPPSARTFLNRIPLRLTAPSSSGPEPTSTRPVS